MSTRTIKSWAKVVPGVQRIRRWQYEQRFTSARGYAAYRGVFSSFEEARASAPAGQPLGFDVEGFEKKYADRPHRIFSYDYRMLFWMQRLLTENSVVFDWGGHLGVHYYGYSKHLIYPPGLRWIVCEVPRIVTAGTEQARVRGETRLRYTTFPQEADGAHLLIAGGSLQYIETPTLPALLRSLARPPAHLLLDRIPLYRGDDFVTLQNAGVGFTPLRVWNRDAFIDELRALGYELVDEWDVPERALRVPTYPEQSFDSFSGVYLVRTPGA
jgi:putative methyltransferase (TIGR04325 family)